LLFDGGSTTMSPMAVELPFLTPPLLLMLPLLLSGA
jgi:hypothetical protein